MGCAELLARLRQYLPEDIGALSLEKAPPRFHARLSCTEKGYLYRIWNSDAPNVFERQYVYRYPSVLDTDAMRRAAQALIEETRFRGLLLEPARMKIAVRRSGSIEINRHGDELRILLTGNGFLYNMVRIIVGTLIEAGRGERDADNIAAALTKPRQEKRGLHLPGAGTVSVGCAVLTVKKPFCQQGKRVFLLTLYPGHYSPITTTNALSLAGARAVEIGEVDMPRRADASDLPSVTSKVWLEPITVALR